MIEYLIDRFKAWFRGEKRVAPKGARGRVYKRKAGGGDLSTVEARSFGAAVIVPSRVYRAAEDRWYTYNPETGGLTPEEGSKSGGQHG